MRNISVTIARAMYDLLLNGRKGTKDEPGVRACKTHQEVVRYLDASMGLLGRVTDVIIE